MPEANFNMTNDISENVTPETSDEDILEQGNASTNQNIDDDPDDVIPSSKKKEKKVLFFLKNRGTRRPSDNMSDDSGNSKKSSSPPHRQLSLVSKQYDIDGDGELNSAEQALRDLDESGRGYISNERVYQLMVKQFELQRNLLNFKRLLIGLFLFTFVLALSNLGTAWAAAKLAKETTVENGILVVKDGSKNPIATDSNIRVIVINDYADGDNQRRDRDRELQQNFTISAATPPTQISKDTASAIYNECPQEVWLKWTSRSGVEKNIKLCGSSTTSFQYSGSTYTYTTGIFGNEMVQVTCNGGSRAEYCDLTGSALDLQAGDTCNPTFATECKSNTCGPNNACVGGTDDICNINEDCSSGSCSARNTWPPVNKCDECNSSSGNNEGCDVASGYQCYSANDMSDVYQVSHIDGGCYKPIDATCSSNTECVSNTCQGGKCRCKTELPGWSGSDWGCSSGYTCQLDTSLNFNQCVQNP